VDFAAVHNDFSLRSDGFVTRLPMFAKGDRYELYASYKCVSGVCGVRIRSISDFRNCALKGQPKSQINLPKHGRAGDAPALFYS
jgi:hypothetical protein